MPSFLGQRASTWKFPAGFMAVSSGPTTLPGRWPIGTSMSWTCPITEQYGLFLRDAFNHHGVSVDRVALGMHGRISTASTPIGVSRVETASRRRSWRTAQYQAVDVRYFYSTMYRDEWRAINPVPATVLDPLWFFDVPRLGSLIRITTGCQT